MKKQYVSFSVSALIINLVMLMALMPQLSFAQKNNLKLGFSKGSITNLNYERSLTKHSSFLVGVRFTALSEYEECWFCNKDVTYTNKGTRLTTEYRLYIPVNDKQLSGLYIAPNLSIGPHQLNYRYRPSNGNGLGTIIGVLVDIATTGIPSGNYNNNQATAEPIDGNANVLAASMGLKLGYQQRWKVFNIDLGFNFSKNTFRGEKGLNLDTGSIVPLEKDLNGFTRVFYFGVGLAF